MTGPASSGAATILVVDDEPKNRKLLEAVLQAEGYRTTTAATGELALLSVIEDRPDLILLDVMMPGMDGYQVASRLKADAETADIPIIIVSALDDRTARLSGLRAGAEEFLTKPIDRAELWLRVRNLLRLKELGDRQHHSAALELQVQQRTADLHHLAHYDALTCLPNRAFLYETLRKTLPLAAGKQWRVAVMFVDIDHFKPVNDTLGHAVGDDLLAQFGVRLLESVRVRDTVGRLGGDEFALILLLEAGSRDDAAVVADKIGAAMRSPFSLAGHEIRISASIGVSIFPDDGQDVDTLLGSADAAMYRAKGAGRDTFRFFTSTMSEDADVRHQIEALARQRIASNSILALSLLDEMAAPTCAVDAAGVITALNRAWREVPSSVAAVAEGIAIGASYLSVFAADEWSAGDALALGLRQVLDGEADRFELTYSRSEHGQQRWFDLVAFPLPNGAGAVISHHDVTVGRRALEDLALTESQDQLTRLPHRRQLLNVLSERLAEGGHVLAAACMGIDRLEHVNESYGYAAGDELLRAISNRAREHLRHGDTLARWAGDEFVVLWPQVASAGEAAELAERLAALFAEPFELAAGTVTVTASVGVALGTAPQSAEALLMAANAAMRDAKRHGPGRIWVHSRELAH